MILMTQGTAVPRNVLLMARSTGIFCDGRKVAHACMGIKRRLTVLIKVPGSELLGVLAIQHVTGKTASGLPLPGTENCIVFQYHQMRCVRKAGTVSRRARRR